MAGLSFLQCKWCGRTKFGRVDKVQKAITAPGWKAPNYALWTNEKLDKIFVARDIWKKNASEIDNTSSIVAMSHKYIASYTYIKLTLRISVQIML